MYIPTIKIPLSDRYGNLFNKDCGFFPIDVKDAYLHIPIVKHHQHFCVLFGKINIISGSFAIWLAIAHMVLTSLTKPNLLLTYSKSVDNRAQYFFVLPIGSSWATLSKAKLHLTQLLFLGLL